MDNDLLCFGRTVLWPVDPALRTPLRLQADLPIPTDKPAWIVVRADGDQPLSATLPGTTDKPFAFTNPIWIGAPTLRR